MVAVVALALVAVAVGALLIRLGSRFPERWRAASRTVFECQLPAGVVVQRLLDVARRQRGWRVEVDGASGIRVHAGTTLYSWRKRIEISVRASTELTSTVSIVSSSPQLHDWGDNRRAVEVLRSGVAEAIWPS